MYVCEIEIRIVYCDKKYDVKSFNWLFLRVDFDAILYCGNRIKIAEGEQSPYLEGKSHWNEQKFPTLYRIPEVIFYSWKSYCI